MLRNYMESLHKLVEEQDKARELAKQQETAALQTMQPSVKLLEQQFFELVRSLNSDQLNRPWTMSEFVMRLKGKYRNRPHPQKISEILKRHNWRRHRTYGINTGRYWLPPSKK